MIFFFVYLSPCPLLFLISSIIFSILHILQFSVLLSTAFIFPSLCPTEFAHPHCIYSWSYTYTMLPLLYWSLSLCSVHVVFNVASPLSLTCNTVKKKSLKSCETLMWQNTVACCSRIELKLYNKWYPSYNSYSYFYIFISSEMQVFSGCFVTLPPSKHLYALSKPGPSSCCDKRYRAELISSLHTVCQDTMKLRDGCWILLKPF